MVFPLSTAASSFVQVFSPSAPPETGAQSGGELVASNRGCDVELGGYGEEVVVRVTVIQVLTAGGVLAEVVGGVCCGKGVEVLVRVLVLEVMVS